MRAVTWVGLGIGGVFLYLFLREIDASRVLEALGSADLRLVLVAMLLQVPLFVLKILRWQVLIPDRHVPWLDLWDATTLGFGANVILPGRVGEAIRVGAIYRMADVPVAQGVSSLLLERLWDFMCVTFYLALGAAFLDLEGGVIETARTVGLTASALFFVCIPVLGLLGRRPRLLLAATRLVSARLPSALGERVDDFASSLAAGLARMADLRALLTVCLISLAHWGLSGVAMALVVLGVGIPVGLAGTLVIQGVLAFAIALPQAPGFLGPFQFAIAETLGQMGTPVALASACAILIWLMGIVPTLLMGGHALLRRGRGVARAPASNREQPAEAPS